VYPKAGLLSRERDCLSQESQFGRSVLKESFHLKYVFVIQPTQPL